MRGAAGDVACAYGTTAERLRTCCAALLLTILCCSGGGGCCCCVRDHVLLQSACNLHALPACAVRLDADTLLPALIRALEAMKQPAARVSVMEFTVLFLGEGKVAGVPASATHVRCVASASAHTPHPAGAAPSSNAQQQRVRMQPRT